MILAELSSPAVLTGPLLLLPDQAVLIEVGDGLVVGAVDEGLVLPDGEGVLVHLVLQSGQVDGDGEVNVGGGSGHLPDLLKYHVRIRSREGEGDENEEMKECHFFLFPRSEG